MAINCITSDGMKGNRWFFISANYEQKELQSMWRLMEKWKKVGNLSELKKMKELDRDGSSIGLNGRVIAFIT